MSRYDVVVIGSGMGGLACGAILAKEGMRVRIVEQNATPGGCLQSFRRGGRLFDTGIHYVGSLREGQIMYQYLKYFGVLPDLHVRMLDPDGFDRIHLDGQVFRHASGFERFEETLASDFPHERSGIHAYCRVLQQIGASISPDVLRKGHFSAGSMNYSDISAAATIDSLVGDPLLRRVLAGSVPLYGGRRDMSPLYHHAIINFSNIEGAACFTGGTQHVADAMIAQFRAHGGELSTRSRATRLRLCGSEISSVEINDGEELLETKWVVSDAPPASTFGLLESTSLLRRVFLDRLEMLPNTYGLFTIHLSIRPGAIPYRGCNHYLYNTSDVWSSRGDFEGYNIPVVLLCSQPSSDGADAETVTLLIPMEWREVARWENTHSGFRGSEYKDFKRRFTEAVLRFTERFVPGLCDAVESVHTSSPLTYRDYTSAPEGTAYGLQKDFNRPFISHIPIRSRIGNLLLTGQNLNVHGMLGVTVSAAFTCSELVGESYLAKKIGYV